MASKNEIKDRAKHTHTFSDFKGVNTQAARQNIGDNEFAWLENLFPLGHGNLLSIPGPSGVLGSIPTGTISFFQSFNLNDTPIIIAFSTLGGGYNINLEDNSVTQFATDGTFSNTGTFAQSWANSDILIIDFENGYFDYDGFTLTQLTGTIQSVVLVSPGSGYTTPPTLTIDPPSSGVTATATADLQLVLATLSAAGTGYQVNDILTLSGGTFFTAAQLTVSAIGAAGIITGFNITQTGDYTVIPTSPAAVTGGFGIGALFNLNFGVGPVLLQNAGTGYTSDPNVTVSGGGGGAPGTVQDIIVTAPGNGYTSPPTLTIDPPSSGVTATATADLQMVLAKVSGAGTDYEPGDILVLQGGTFNTAAQLQVTSVNASTGAITGFSILQVGDYSAIPTGSVSVVGGFGSSATFTLNFGIGPVTLTNPGSGYTSNPNVTLSGGSGQLAVLVANVNVISSAVVVANLSVVPGSGDQIAVFSGRVWISDGARTIIFSAPDDFTDFRSSTGGGSFVIEDSTLINLITGLYSANNYLYVFGKTSIDVISGVQIVNGETVFSRTNITASIGTNEFTSIVPYYRGLAFATQYGFYILNGTTCQKISNELDGYYRTMTGAIPISGGYFNLSNNICLGFLSYTSGNPYAPYSRALLAIYFDKKWTFSSQGDNLKLCCTALYNGNPVLYGTDGTNFYSLMTNNEIYGAYTFKFTHTMVSKLWNMGEPFREKQTLKYGMETNVGTFTANPVAWIVDTENPGNFQPGSFFPGAATETFGYSFGKLDVEVYGNYIGIQSNDQYSEITFSAFHIQYELCAQWSTLPISTPSAPLAPQLLTAVAGPGDFDTTETWQLVAGAATYNLYWSTTEGAGTSGHLISGILGTTYNQTGLASGVRIYYVVTAVNPISGESPPSNEASAVPTGGSDE